MNIYEFINCNILRRKKFKIGQIWKTKDPDPFNKIRITITAIKDHYVQYVYTNGSSSHYSNSMDYIWGSYTFDRDLT
jgi:phage protein D